MFGWTGLKMMANQSILIHCTGENLVYISYFAVQTAHRCKMITKKIAAQSEKCEPVRIGAMDATSLLCKAKPMPKHNTNLDQTIVPNNRDRQVT